jgi:Spy/CpxP family protein refolding chaperone
MTMKQFRFLIPLVAAVSLAAQPAPRGGGWPAAGLAEVKAYLSLTDAQVTSLEQLRQQQREAVRSDLEQIRVKQGELKAAVERSDAATAGRLLIEIEGIHKRVQQAHERYRAQAIAVLNDAQKTKLKALEEAAKLMPLVGQAGALNLLPPPELAGDGVGRGWIGPMGAGRMRPGMGTAPGFGPMPMGRGPRL